MQNLTVAKVTCTATDTSSTVLVRPVQIIYNQYEILLTTTTFVTSSNDLETKQYSILFTLVWTRPELTLVHDSVRVGKEIYKQAITGCIAAESTRVYLNIKPLLLF